MWGGRVDSFEDRLRINNDNLSIENEQICYTKR
ncbi:MAG: hypothetical protein UU02_C0034G0007 [Candidatus Woesebacteria bacterium GW2011_GWA1_40_43]|uniref:Uncharacterized protein n=4 Tax=Microgenomates group TaxID=1794810 RepID=A0A0G1QEL3_9BACT|nr:MAG: hypothetical protein UU02_C0034G0007 [Candidatus Woesebacteria bacterium GW2011_GWA1_40_43]KKT66066.1 MAG: hypothetical protein UW60_C0029G0009 [Candidatus Woesebacteria bacterium GW2011_GWA2_44_33]KKT67056.1 MAG: hypothetical protein UW61_C0016G0003 [Candidatus Curtissbacteria bacterium GW2011_GWC1_44_33]KKU16173.1 MAG: hypothetical protein UX25_C0041G0005 [Candidatus Woesebacteria bacterium GW2011_GWC2_45_9]